MAQGSQNLSVFQSSNQDHDIDLEAVIDTEGMEWVNVDITDTSNISPSWSQVVTGCASSSGVGTTV